MPFFKKSIFTSDCDRCHMRFHIGAGGVCEECRRILCDTHLHGSFVRRVQVSFGAPNICVSCRYKRAKSATASKTAS